MTYFNRTQPKAVATLVLTPVQLDVLKAKSDKLPKVLTVAWAVESVARLGGYLEHRRKHQLVFRYKARGWLKLASLCVLAGNWLLRLSGKSQKRVLVYTCRGEVTLWLVEKEVARRLIDHRVFLLTT